MIKMTLPERACKKCFLSTPCCSVDSGESWELETPYLEDLARWPLSLLCLFEQLPK